MMKEPIEVLIARKVKEKGGNTYYVGGFVRDRLLNIDNKDVDIEVHGIGPEVLKTILDEIGTTLEYGKDFGVFSLAHENIDIAMPRKEICYGLKHTDFNIEVDPFIGVKEAARRRDFTINSIMQDVLTGEVIDSFNGIEDLKNKLIRHVDSKSFPKDPLRVFRACQFASRLEFSIAEETIELCKNIDVTKLSKERIEEELKKALIKAQKPSIFFKELARMNQLDYWFKEVKQLIGCTQDPIYHPEGDVFTHTMNVIDEAAKYKDKVLNSYYFMWFSLCHDFGKVDAHYEDNGRIHNYGHETILDYAKAQIKRITNENDLYRYVTNMVPLHMKLNAMYRDNAGWKSTNRLFDKAIDKLGLIYFAFSDHPEEGKEIEESDRYIFFMDRLDLYNKTMAEPYVTGDDLINAGYEPDIYFKDALEFAHKLRLASVNKDSAFKQTIALIKKHEREKTEK